MHLGKKLQNLRLHENSTFGVPRRVLTDGEIAFIGQNCPHLVGLAIDVIGEDLWVCVNKLCQLSLLTTYSREKLSKP